jgi:chromatin assembly factor 1 subunit A
MANFFARTKAGPSIPPTGYKGATGSTDFDRVFKPFALRKGVEVAPINHFGTHRRLLEGVEDDSVIVLDDETPLPPSSAPGIRSPPASLPGMIYIRLCKRTPTKPPL